MSNVPSTSSDENEDAAYARLVGEDNALICGQVEPSFIHLPAIPVGDNPMRHDHWHMGTHLVRGWVAMHEGFDNPKGPLPLRYVILVNIRSGQRIRVNLDRLRTQRASLLQVKSAMNWWNALPPLAQEMYREEYPEDFKATDQMIRRITRFWLHNFPKTAQRVLDGQSSLP